MPHLDDALLLELIDLTFDHACGRPLREFVDVSKALPALDAVAEPERAARWQRRVVVPLRERLLARAAKSGVPLGRWLPDDVTAALRERLGRPRPIPQKWVDEVVANERVREAVRAMLSEALTSFVQKASAALTDNKSAGQGGIRGAFGWGAKAAGSLIGSIGDEVQQRLQERVRDYVDIAVGNVQQRIAERLRSEDTAKAIGKRRLALFEKALKTTEAEAVKGADKVQWADLDARGPRVAAHNLARAEVREAIAAELEAVLAEVGGDTLGAALDDLGLRDLARESVRTTALPGLRDLARTERFEAWWARAVAAGPAEEAAPAAVDPSAPVE